MGMIDGNGLHYKHFLGMTLSPYTSVLLCNPRTGQCLPTNSKSFRRFVCSIGGNYTPNCFLLPPVPQTWDERQGQGWGARPAADHSSAGASPSMAVVRAT